MAIKHRRKKEQIEFNKKHLLGKQYVFDLVVNTLFGIEVSQSGGQFVKP